jgi:hypothetical protein
MTANELAAKICVVAARKFVWTITRTSFKLRIHTFKFNTDTSFCYLFLVKGILAVRSAIWVKYEQKLP